MLRTRTTMFAAALALCSLSSLAHGVSTLSAVLTSGQGPVSTGQIVQVEIRMSNLSTASAGFQAFLHFDPTELHFVNGSYTSVPFGLAVIAPITATAGGDIDLA